MEESFNDLGSMEPGLAACSAPQWLRKARRLPRTGPTTLQASCPARRLGRRSDGSGTRNHTGCEEGEAKGAPWSATKRKLPSAKPLAQMQSPSAPKWPATTGEADKPKVLRRRSGRDHSGRCTGLTPALETLR